MLIVGFDSTLQFRQSSCQLLVRPDDFPQRDEGAHDSPPASWLAKVET
jgi:hypothetical protein